MKRLIVLTQCFKCGSWVCIEKILNKLSDHGYTITVIGLGETQQRNNKFRYCAIPYPEFNRYGFITCLSPLLNIVWNLPLIVTGFMITLFQKPEAVIYNGLATGLTMSPFIRLRGSKNIVMYHSFLGHTDGMLKQLMKMLGSFVDIIVVNSLGSYHDVSPIINPKKILINEHYAEDIFFSEVPESDTSRNHVNFNITYIGRIDEDKLCFPLMDVARKMGPESGFIFNFAGGGSALDKIQKLAQEQSNVRYLGYIKSREDLQQIYKNADVLWGLANETYLTLPAVEALACGTPIIVPIYGEVRDRLGGRKLVDKELVPNNIGWFVDTNDIDEVVTLIKKIKTQGITKDMRSRCVDYAKRKYSSANLDDTILKILSVINYDSK